MFVNSQDSPSISKVAQMPDKRSRTLYKDVVDARVNDATQ